MFTNQINLRRLPLGLLLASAALTAGCVDSDEEALAPETPQAGGELFSRYVAIGNSITAGYQSAGINDSTQRQAYPVLLAQQAGVDDFNYPALAMPGCPPPLAGPFSTVRVTTGLPAGAPAQTGSSCYLRANVVQRPLQNLAVPGARIASGLDINAAANALTTIVLGGRSQFQAARDAQPSLVSVWLGNNNVLEAALAGVPALATSSTEFQTSAAALADSIRSLSTVQDAVLIGVVDPTVVPALQPGAFYFLAASATGGRFGGPTGKPVNSNCAPGTPGGSNMISIQILADANFPEINCSNEAYPTGDPRRSVYVLTPAEAAAISQRVAEFNTALSARAQANNWVYINPNAVLLAASNNGQDPSRIRKCQALPAALLTGNPVNIQTAIGTSCPSADPNVGFGSLISYDGVHPSAFAHRLVTNALIDALNAKHNLSIPTLST